MHANVQTLWGAARRLPGHLRLQPAFQYSDPAFPAHAGDSSRNPLAWRCIELCPYVLLSTHLRAGAVRVRRPLGLSTGVRVSRCAGEPGASR